jgi:dihydrolipoamide dehydrogenase
VLDLDHARGRGVGGGAIGCEFASFLVDVGSEVTILEVLPQVLGGVDPQVAQAVVRAFTKRGIKVQTGVGIVGLDPTGSDLAIRFEGKGGEERLTVDQVVVSVGRRPRSDNIGLEDAGVKIDERGFVSVDGNMRTSADGVYSVGDVVATPQLAHVAFSEGIVAIKTMLGEQPADRMTRCRASTAILKSRSRAPRSRRTSGATTSRRRCTAGAATGAR